MHIGIKDRLWNWPFLQLVDLDLWSCHTASTSSYTPNFVQIRKSSCGWMDGYVQRMEGFITPT